MTILVLSNKNLLCREAIVSLIVVWKRVVYVGDTIPIRVRGIGRNSAVGWIVGIQINSVWYAVSVRVRSCSIVCRVIRIGIQGIRDAITVSVAWGDGSAVGGVIGKRVQEVWNAVSICV